MKRSSVKMIGASLAFTLLVTNGMNFNYSTGHLGSLNEVNASSTSQTKTHIVKKGETLYRVSRMYGVTVANIKTWNKLTSDSLKIGQTLVITNAPKDEGEKPVPPSTPTITYTTTTNVNMRISPSTSGKIMTTLKKGTKLTVIGNAINRWYKVSLNGKIGYVSSQYVAESISAPINIPVVSQPDSITVLVNKNNSLPKNYTPKDLVYTSIPFISNEWSEKRKMRKEASVAISKLVEGAKKDKIYLLGISAYRSNATQTSLFNAYVKRDGYAKAITYSAFPGTSEHETGLTIDVAGADSKCAAQDCFANTKEAKWLAQNAHNYGFIIRYPKGKEAITGYKYEPWHLRYVGVDLAKKLTSQGITLEEYTKSKKHSFECFFDLHHPIFDFFSNVH